MHFNLLKKGCQGLPYTYRWLTPIKKRNVCIIEFGGGQCIFKNWMSTQLLLNSFFCLKSLDDKA